MIWSSSLWALVAATLGSALVLPTKRADVCNGRAELCGRAYSNVTFAGSHDSYAFSKNPFNLGRNQEVDIRTQLDSGIRLLQAQSHKKDDELHFCHTNCVIFDGGKVEDYLKTVKSWLDDNPKEVLTLLFTNPEGVDVGDVWDPIFKSTGIEPLAFIPPNSPEPLKKNDWPTLGEMIDSGKRVVVFFDASVDMKRVPYILDEFQFIWETPFNSVDAAFPCKVDRVLPPLAQTEHMSLINHYLDKEVLGIDDLVVPDFLAADNTNGVDSIVADAAGCAGFNENRSPNFVLMDFVNKGEPLKAIDKLNGF